MEVLSSSIISHYLVLQCNICEGLLIGEMEIDFSGKTALVTGAGKGKRLADVTLLSSDS